MERIINFFKETDGMELTEYAVVGSLIIAAVIAVFTLWGTGLATLFNGILTNLGIA